MYAFSSTPLFCVSSSDAPRPLTCASTRITRESGFLEIDSPANDDGKALVFAATAVCLSVVSYWKIKGKLLLS
jgi:hypothetical protein